jgi:hypothetical protein
MLCQICPTTLFSEPIAKTFGSVVKNWIRSAGTNFSSAISSGKVLRGNVTSCPVLPRRFQMFDPFFVLVAHRTSVLTCRAGSKYQFEREAR